MSSAGHNIELIVDRKGLRTTGRKVVLRVDGETVYKFDTLQRKRELNMDEFEASAFEFLFQGANAVYGHADRLRLVTSCAERPKTFTELKEAFNMTSPTLNYHLKKLVDSWIFYKNEVDKYALTLLGQLILDHFSKFLHEAKKLKVELQETTS